jgi:hypothetical protein
VKQANARLINPDAKTAAEEPEPKATE